jgi:hypothetical protein
VRLFAFADAADKLLRRLRGYGRGSYRNSLIFGSGVGIEHRSGGALLLSHSMASRMYGVGRHNVGEGFGEFAEYAIREQVGRRNLTAEGLLDAVKIGDRIKPAGRPGKLAPIGANLGGKSSGDTALTLGISPRTVERVRKVSQDRKRSGAGNLIPTATGGAGRPAPPVRAGCPIACRGMTRASYRRLPPLLWCACCPRSVRWLRCAALWP